MGVKTGIYTEFVLEGHRDIGRPIDYTQMVIGCTDESIGGSDQIGGSGLGIGGSDE